MRSAERGPIPGMSRSWAIKSRIAEGYSVFLKTPGASLVQRRVGQLQGERLEPPEIQLERPVLFSLRPTGILKLRVRFSPALFAVEHHAVPEGIAPGDDLARSIQRQGDRFVNFVPFAHIHAAQEIDRARDKDLAGQLESARPEQNARAIKAVRDAEPSR